MKKVFIASVLMAGLMGSSAWALFETNQELAKSATVTLDKAVLAAVAAMPGKAVEAELSKEEGRTVYKVEIIDHNNKTQKVYVDAQTMQTRIDK
ncbi:MAG TPA: PepSY domain-containing protein [Nitrospira sp.]|nr:PepSY domain-containing protein [Nitrospira sp.]